MSRARGGSTGAAIAIAAGGLRAGLASRDFWRSSWRDLWLHLIDASRAALELEIAQRRLFLWLPVAAGAGVILYFAADREPSLAYAALIAAAAVILAIALRRRPVAFGAALTAAAIACGFPSATLRSALLAALVLDRPQVLKFTGTIEEMYLRRQGGRASSCGSARPKGFVPNRRLFACASPGAMRPASRPAT